MKQVFKRFAEAANRRKTALMATVAAVGLMTPASASTVDVSATLNESFTGIVNTLIATIAGLLPVVLPLMALSVTIGLSVKWFKALVGMAGAKTGS